MSDQPEQNDYFLLYRSRPLRWRIWWRFGFRPIVRLVNLIPIAEWRREQWIWRLDIWAMDHIGRSSHD